MKHIQISFWIFLTNISLKVMIAIVQKKNNDNEDFSSKMWPWLMQKEGEID